MANISSHVEPLESFIIVEDVAVGCAVNRRVGIVLSTMFVVVRDIL